MNNANLFVKDVEKQFAIRRLKEMSRKYAHCFWCGKTIDVTNNDDELCSECCKYPSMREMLKAKAKGG